MPTRGVPGSGSRSQAMPASTASQARPSTAARARSHCSRLTAAHHNGFRVRSGVRITARSRASPRSRPGGVAASATDSAHRCGSCRPPGRRAPRVASSTADRAAGVAGGNDERPSTARTSDAGDAVGATRARRPIARSPSRRRRNGSGRSGRTQRVNGQPVRRERLPAVVPLDRGQHHGQARGAGERVDEVGVRVLVQPSARCRPPRPAAGRPPSARRRPGVAPQRCARPPPR